MRIRILLLVCLATLSTALLTKGSRRPVEKQLVAIEASGRKVLPKENKKSEVLLPLKSRSKQDEKTYDLTIRIKDFEKYSIAVALIIGDGYAAELTFKDEEWNDTDYAVISVPAGEYDVCLDMGMLSEGGMSIEYNIFYAKENIKVPDTEEVQIDPADADIEYTFSSVKKDGQIVELSTYEAYDNPDNEYVMDMVKIKEGTVGLLTIKSMLWSKKRGGIFGNTGQNDCNVTSINGDTEFHQYPIERENCRMNKTDNYFPLQLRAYQSGETENEVVSLIPATIGTQIVSNTVEDFIDYPVPLFDRIAASEESEHQPADGAFPVVDMYLNGITVAAQNLFIPPLVTKGKDQIDCSMIRNSTSRKPTLIKDNYMRIAPRAMDMMVHFQIDTIWFSEDYFIVLDKCRSTYDFGRTIEIPNNHETEMGGQILTGYLSVNEDFTKNISLPYHPYFPDYSRMNGKKYNSTQPYVTNLFNSSRILNYMDYTFIDNLGGKISTYQYATDYKVKLDGETFFESKDYEDLLESFDALQNKLGGLDAPGKFDWEMMTLRGNIGGVDSYTRFNAKFGQSSTDGSAPTLQILSFVDEEGNFTTDFKSADNGRILLVGGDVELSPYGLNDTQCFAPVRGKITPVVEYSVYGKEDWKALTLNSTQVEADPCYGDSWEIDMKEIGTPFDKTLYDLRISMTDESGNSMTQVVSPAFSIDKNTGLKATDHEKLNIYVEGNSIRGPKDMKVFSADGHPCGSDNLPRGLYIVHTSRGTVKLVL